MWPRSLARLRWTRDRLLLRSDEIVSRYRDAIDRALERERRADRFLAVIGGGLDGLNRRSGHMVGLVFGEVCQASPSRNPVVLLPPDGPIRAVSFEPVKLVRVLHQKELQLLGGHVS